MIMTVEELKQFITTSESDTVLEAKLQALELLIRKYTNNNFQKRNFREKASVMTTKLYLTTDLFNVGDTVQISESIYNDGIYVIKEIQDGFITLDAVLIDEPQVLVTKVEYPQDVKMGIVGMIKWQLSNGDKVGISSETISRHSVTYFSMDGSNTSVGFPTSLTSYLKPYMKARF